MSNAMDGAQPVEQDKDIRFLQARLVEIGVLRGEFTSGVFDQKTREALKAWQRSKGDAPTGSLSESERHVLGMNPTASGPTAAPKTWRNTYTTTYLDENGKFGTRKAPSPTMMMASDSVYRIENGTAVLLNPAHRTDMEQFSEAVSPSPKGVGFGDGPSRQPTFYGEIMSGPDSTFAEEFVEPAISFDGVQPISGHVQSGTMNPPLYPADLIAGAASIVDRIKRIRTWMKANPPYNDPAFYDNPEVIQAFADAIETGEPPSFEQLMALPSMEGVNSQLLAWNQMSGADQAQIVSNSAAEIQNAAGTMGLSLSSGTINGIATQASMYGWNAAQIQDALANHIGSATSANPGLVQQVYEYAKDQGSAFLVNIDDGTAMSLARRVATGELDASAIPAYFKQQAMARYPHLADIIESGVTPGEYFSPYRQQVASVLELSPGDIDFVNDDRWSKITGIAGDDGKPRAMTLSEAATYAREQDEYKTTRGANENASKMVAGLGEMFGALKL